MKLRNVAVAAAALLASTAANAITYLGTAAAGIYSASYSIDTDGTLGALATGNIVAVAGTVTDGTTTVSLNTFVLLAGLSATASTLTFDPTITAGFALIGSGNGGVVCFDSPGVACLSNPRPAVVVGTDYFAGAWDYVAAPRTSYTIAAAVPEPATWAMLIAGFGLTGAALRRRNAATVAA